MSGFSLGLWIINDFFSNRDSSSPIGRMNVGDITPPRSLEQQSFAESPAASSTSSSPPPYSLISDDEYSTDCNSGGGGGGMGIGINGATAAGMLDRTRLSLCMFMLAILAFNPFGSLLNHATSSWPGESPSPVGRSILAATDDVIDTLNTTGWSLFGTVSVWLVNLLLLTFVLLRTLIVGEPFIERHSKDASLYWRQRKQADCDINQGQFVAAAGHYRQALAALGRPVSTSRIDVVASVGWNMLRQMLHRLGLTRWLSGRVGKLFLSRDERRVGREFLAEAALCYHKLHQLHLSQQDPTSCNSHHWLERYRGLALSLAATNLAEAAGPALNAMTKADVYIHLALRIKHSFSGRGFLWARFYLAKARHLCQASNGNAPARLQWLCTSAGYRFFVKHRWEYDELPSTIFTSLSNKADPLAFTMQVGQFTDFYQLPNALRSSTIVWSYF